MRTRRPNDSIGWQINFITDSRGENNSVIHVIATIELKPGTRNAFLAEFRKLMPAVLAEVGCIEYGPAVDVPSSIVAQIPIRESVVTIVEKWESLEHLKTHLSAPHMGPYRQAVAEFVVATKLVILEPV